MTKQAVVDESRQPTENGDQTDEKASIWASILRDVKSSTKKAPASKCLVVLGDNESGRTTLVAKLQGNDDPKRGAGLEYHYIDVKDDDRDDTPKLGVWILDGDAACSAPLLKFAIKPESLEDTILVLVASMTQPWSLLSTLKKWTTLIEEHIDRLKIDPTHLQQMRDQLQYDFQHYSEPNDSSIMLTSSASSTTIKSGIGGSRVPSSVSSVSLASITPSSLANGEEQIVLPLADGVLIKSLVIPVIVVITKCDVMPTLEKDNDYKDEYFDFMQHQLRKFCLEYGAALFYTSVKEKKNIDKLYKYIVHKCYGYPFASSAAVVDRDAIFIPAGWDNPKKADILLENLHRLKSTDNYSDVFVKPLVRRPLQRDNEIIIADDDQEFLARLQLTLNRAASPGRGDENGASQISRPPPRPPTTPGTGKQPNSSNASTGDQNRPGANDGALANFFNSLLTKKPGAPGTPTTAGTPTTQRQTSQSPTTPSSKRLQQHPLTFAVTPPPGRSRTPTSNKTFISSLNTDSPPKSLSPVAERHPKDETTSLSSALPTIVRTPVEDGEPVKIFDSVGDKRSSITDAESAPLDYHEQPSDHTLQHENEPIPNVEPKDSESTVSQFDSTSNTIDDSLLEDRTNAVQTPSNDESHRRLSNDLPLLQSIESEQEKEVARSPSSQKSTTELAENHDQIIDNLSSTNHSRPISPVLLEEVLNEGDQKISSSTNQSRSSTSILNDTHKQLTLENTEPQNNKDENEYEISSNAPHEELSKSPTGDISLNNDNQEEQQHNNPKESLNSSRRDSTTNVSIPSRPSSPVTNEPQVHEDQPLTSPVEDQPLTSPVEDRPTPLNDDEIDIHYENELSEDRLHSNQLERQTSSSDIQPSEVSNDDLLTNQSTGYPSISNLSTSEEEQQVDQMAIPLSTTQDNLNYSLSSRETSDEYPTLYSSSVTENDNSVQSFTLDHLPSSPTNVQQSDSSFPEDDPQQLPTNEATLSSSHIAQNPESTTLIESHILDSDDVKSELLSNTTVSSASGNQKTRSESPSSIADEKQQRSRPPSPTVEQEQQRTRSPSPTDQQQQQQQRSRSPSPIHQQERRGSRSPSPTVEQEQQRTRSPSPTDQQEQQRARSPSLTQQEEQQQRSRSPSLTGQHEQQRTRSPSPTDQQERQGSRSPSLIHQEEQKQRSRSPSPTDQLEQQGSLPLSSTDQQEQRGSRSSSINIEQEQQRSRSPSPTVQQEQLGSRSLSPIHQQEQQRSRSPSPMIDEEQQRNQSPSPTHQHERRESWSPSPTIEQEQRGSRSPSPIHQQEQQRSRSPSSNVQQEQQRSRSTSPMIDEEQQRNQSPSPTHQHERRESRSPSPTIKQEQRASRSPPPTDQQEQQRSRSPSPTVQQEQRGSRSPSPMIDEGQQRNQSPSPTHQQEQQESLPSSPTIQQEQQRNLSPSPPHQQKQRNSDPASPTYQQEQQQRSRSPSPTTEHEQARNKPWLSDVEQAQLRSRSPSPTNQQKQSQSRSRSPTSNHSKQGNKSASPSDDPSQQRSRSPSPNMEHNDPQSQSSSSITKTKQTGNLFASSPLNENRERTASPSSSVDHDGEENRSSSPSIEHKGKGSLLPSSLQQEQKLERSPSPIYNDQRKKSFPIDSFEDEVDFTSNNDLLSGVSSSHESETLSTSKAVSSSSTTDSHQEVQSNILASPSFEEGKSHGLSADLHHDTIHHVKANGTPSSMVEPEQSDRTRSSSLTPLSLEKRNELRNHEQLKESSSSPLTENLIEEPLLAPSPTNQQKTSFKDNHPSQTLKSPVHENIRSTTLEKHSSLTSIPSNDSEQQNRSHSPARRSSLTRSQSQSAVARPKTLPFSPNNHDLDGLYTSNDYNDEDELPEDSDHHHNSAPSTVTVEYRRSSLLDNSNIQPEHTPIDPNDITKRLSIIEKSRTDDNDMNETDPTNSKDTRT